MPFNFGTNTINQSTPMGITSDRAQLSFPPDVESKRGIEQAYDEFGANKLMDIMFNQLFYFSTTFESIDGYDTLSTGAGSGSVDPDGLFVQTGVTLNDAGEVAKAPNPSLSGAASMPPMISWKQPQRFRATFALDTIASQLGYIIRGSDPSGGLRPYYGFRIDSEKLYGVTKRNGAGAEQKTLALATLTGNREYTVETRYEPNSQVSFWVKNDTTYDSSGSNELKLRGIINYNDSSFPHVNDTDLNGFFDFFIKNLNGGAGSNKAIACSFLEYIQLRDKY